METQERGKGAAEEPLWYESAARPSPPGALTQAEPAGVTRAEPEKNAGACVNIRKVRWIVGVYVVVATVEVALGRWFDSVYWASVAFFFAVSLQPRERVPKPLRYFALAVMLALTVFKVVLLLNDLKVR